jgi:hypothetical protein
MNRNILRMLSKAPTGLLLLAIVAIGLIFADVSSVYARGRGGFHGGGGVSHNRHDHHRRHPVAVGLAVGAAIAIGTRVATLPHGCSSMMVGNVMYQSCGGTYYKPYYQGTTVVYEVVVKP